MPTLHSATAFNATDLDGNDLLVTKSAVLVWLDAAGGYDGTAHFEFSPNRTTWFDITGEVLGEGVAAESVASPTDEAYVVRAPLNSWFRVRMSDGTQGSLTVRAQNTTVETQGIEAQSAAAAVSIADGSDVALGSKTDAASAVFDATSRSLIALVKGIAANVLGLAADAAVAAGATGSISAKLRAISRDLVANIVLAAGENHMGQVSGHTALVSAAAFTRPNDTNPYISGDLVANSTTAGSVTKMSFVVARVAGGTGAIRRCRLRKTGTSVTAASFRLHLYTADPTPANGDNGAWSTDQAANYIGALDVSADRAFTDGAAGNGVPVSGSEINFDLSSGQTIYGLLEARAAYTPTAQEQFTLALEVYQD